MSHVSSSSSVGGYAGGNYQQQLSPSFQQQQRQQQRAYTQHESAEKIKVILRVRPILRHDKGTVAAVKATTNRQEIEVVVGDQLKSFAFNLCCGPDVNQEAFFNLSGIQKLVADAMRGYKNTCFAYGQTGSGKTFTMSGVEEKLGTEDYQLQHPTQGVITRALQYLFDQVQSHPDSGAFRIEASAIEIYNERVYDLLYYTGKPLAIRQSKLRGFIPENLRTFHSPDMARMSLILQEAHKNRRVASHDVHADSSRSHAVFTIHVNHRDYPERAGQLTFVDLAGSEKIIKTGAKGKILKEANFINKSLFTLGKVISKLSHPSYEASSTHVPFRDSALTKLLMDSFIGGTQTIMIACVSPGANSLEETVNTAQYATRAKNIINKPTLQIDPEQRLKSDLLREVKQLRMDNARLCQQIEHLGAVPVTVSGKEPTDGPPRPQQRPDSSYSSRSAPISTAGRSTDMAPGFLPPIQKPTHSHNHAPASDVGPRTDTQFRAAPPLHENLPHLQDEYKRRVHELSPMAHIAPGDHLLQSSYADSIEEQSEIGTFADEPDIDDNASQSSSASVDSETGQRVYNYNQEFWDEGAGRFLTKPNVHQSKVTSPNVALGMNPVVAAYGVNDKPGSKPGPGYAARALLKQQMIEPKKPKKASPKVRPVRSNVGYLEQFKAGRR